MEERTGWHVYYADVCIGWIAARAGVPRESDQWAWYCGFYPGAAQHTERDGTGVDFEQARARFEGAWGNLAEILTEANLQEWRDQRDWTERKYAMWARGEKLPSQRPSSLMRCPCGATFDSQQPDESYSHRQHIYAAQKRDGISR
ncbi:hypothetical protein [Bradyrhizobium embrapense]|uniref:hypothetical protein n=1 Tax=Bradyrhizobium embrapense TaxID=630921 RepID=UPI000A624D9C|nr:hypothetical protein [Bradyrhizobium embrapense]